MIRNRKHFYFFVISSLLINNVIPKCPCDARDLDKSLNQKEAELRQTIETLKNEIQKDKIQKDKTLKKEKNAELLDKQLDLAVLLKNWGRDREAETICRATLKGYEETEPDSLAVADAQDHLGRILRHQGRYAESEFYQRKVLAARQKLLPKGHSGIAGALIDLGKVVQLTKGQEAKAIFSEALAIEKKSGNKEGQNYASASLASCLMQLNEVPEARKLYQAYLDETSPTSRPDLYGSLLINIGGCYLAEKKYVEAAKYFNQALKMFEDNGNQFTKLGFLLRQLSKISVLQGHFGLASEQLERAMTYTRAHSANKFEKASQSDRFEFIPLLKRLHNKTNVLARSSSPKTANKSSFSPQLSSSIDEEITILEKLKVHPDAAKVVPALEKIYNSRVAELGQGHVLTCEVSLQIAAMLSYLNSSCDLSQINGQANSAVPAFANKLLQFDSERDLKFRSTVDLLGGKKEALSFAIEELIWLANLNGVDRKKELAAQDLQLAEKCIIAQYPAKGSLIPSAQVAKKFLRLSSIWCDLANLRQSARLAEYALATSENVKDDKIKYAALLQLANLDITDSDLEPAKEHASAARNIAIKCFGPLAQEVTPCDRILAQISLATGDFKTAKYYAVEALGCVGVDKSNTVFAHNIYGFALLCEGNYRGAQKELETSLELCDDELNNQVEDRSLFTAASTALAEAYVKLGDTKNALRELDWALNTDQSNDVAEGLLASARDCAGLSRVQELEGEHESASRYALQAAEFIDKFLKARITQLSFAQQCSLVNVTRQMRSLLLDNCSDPKSLPLAYGYIMRWEGLLIETLRSQSATNAAIAEAPERTRNTMIELTQTRSKLGELANGSESTRAEVISLTEKKERLERELAGLMGSQFFTDVLKDHDANWFRNLLKPDQAFLDILTYRSSKDSHDHYALIAMKAGAGGEPHFFDLGSKNDIDKQINNWRNNITVQIPSTMRDALRDTQRDGKRDLQLDSPTQALSMSTEDYLKLSQSLINLFVNKTEVSNFLGSGVKRIWLCPQSEIARVPWNSLGTICGVSNLTISEVDSPRELVQIALNRSIASSKESRLLLAGVGAFHDDSFNDLPGTEKEIRGIKEQADLVSFPNEMLFNGQANKTNVCEKSSKATIVHLSTHGFARGDKSAPDQIPATPNVEFGLLSISSAISRNPLVDSGLVLSSSLQPEVSTAKSVPSTKTISGQKTKPASDNSLTPKLAYLPNASTLRSSDFQNYISRSRSTSEANEKSFKNLLTAEEIVALNLKNCKLVTLSACKTGLGTGLDGQGVIGLRSAILAAGARSILMSLWSVDDDATQQLMCKFYGYLLDPAHPLTEVEALTKAQEFVRSQPQWKAPIYWAGWVIAGDGWQTVR